ncbi:MAG: hypothetical protein OXI87_01795 [Albidovulum sp.]|nr:hypothetical protein [Albidovulum sp.]
MSEITRLPTRELEDIRAEDRHRKEALTKFLDEFTAQFSRQRERYENTAGFDSGPGGLPGQIAGFRGALKQA